MKYKNKLFKQVFPFKDAFGVDAFEKELMMAGYRFKGKLDKPRLSLNGGKE